MFKIGDIVRIDKLSEYYNGSIYNPKDINGTVTSINNYGKHNIRVRWNNKSNTSNSYRPGDLILSSATEINSKLQEEINNFNF